MAKVKRVFLNLGIAIGMLIPIVSLLVMWEVVTFPRSHLYMGYFVAGYLVLVLILLAREILIDLWRWLRGGGQ